ncbi:MAG: hypothetical protein EBR82_86935 [Caulobacteraceae bacterium]|nr:hypothetical protein [Caulobacteraceae bacterium]
MARTRSVKPSFFKNEYLAECEPMARLLFVGLWTLADSQGRMEFRPLRIKAEIFPYENCDILGLLKQLADRGFVRAYESGDMKVLEIPTFGEHQRCHPDERDEGLPPPDESAQTIVFPEQNEKPGNPALEPGNPPASCALYPSTLYPSTSIPLDAPSTPKRRCSKPDDPIRWTSEKGWEGITDADHAEWSQAYPAADLPVELAKANQWLKANPKKARKSNWRRWLTTVWLSKCQDRGGTHREAARPAAPPPPKSWLGEYRPSNYRTPKESAALAASIKLKEEILNADSRTDS